MEKFIPYQKLSKKKQRELDRKRRGTWGGLNPVTRTPANSKAYNRQKARRRNREDFPSVPFYAFLGMLVPIPEFQKELLGRGSYRRYQREVKQGIAGIIHREICAICGGMESGRRFCQIRRSIHLKISYFRLFTSYSVKSEKDKRAGLLYSPHSYSGEMAETTEQS